MESPRTLLHGHVSGASNETQATDPVRLGVHVEGIPAHLHREVVELARLELGFVIERDAAIVLWFKRSVG